MTILKKFIYIALMHIIILSTAHAGFIADLLEKEGYVPVKTQVVDAYNILAEEKPVYKKKEGVSDSAAVKLFQQEEEDWVNMAAERAQKVCDKSDLGEILFDIVQKINYIGMIKHNQLEAEHNTNYKKVRGLLRDMRVTGEEISLIDHMGVEETSRKLPHNTLTYLLDLSDKRSELIIKVMKGNSASEDQENIQDNDKGNCSLQ